MLIMRKRQLRAKKQVGGGRRKQIDGIFKGSRKQIRGAKRRAKQTGGLLPFLAPLAALALPAAKAAATAAGLGLMGTVGHHIGDSIATRIRGGRGKKRKGVQRLNFVGVVKQRLGRHEANQK